MIRSTLALLTLTLMTACDDRRDHDDDGEAATETESASEEDGEASDTELEPEDDSAGSSSVTPLVLAFRGEVVQFNTAVVAGFDLTGTMSVITDWPTSTTPWLALDRNGNGKIDDGGELFGSATLLLSGEPASNGFVALRDLDSNLDGRLDGGDDLWHRVLVWSDVNGDRVSTGNELSTAIARELVAIDLDYAEDRRCDARGNCEVERAGFVYRDGRGDELRGAVIDVHLRLR